MQRKHRVAEKHSHLINLDKMNEWIDIVRESDKSNIPVDVMDFFTLNLEKGESVTINVADLIEKHGYSTKDIQEEIKQLLDEIGDGLLDVDYTINVNKVKKMIESLTEETLKDLKK